MAAWPSAAEVGAPAPPARAQLRNAHRSRVVASRRLAGGVVWIVLVTALLAGVVAVNVAVLRLNIDLDRATRERARLQADNATLASQLSRAAAGPRVQALARTRYGLVPADPARTVFVDLSP